MNKLSSLIIISLGLIAGAASADLVKRDKLNSAIQTSHKLAKETRTLLSQLRKLSSHKQKKQMKKVVTWVSDLVQSAPNHSAGQEINDHAREMIIKKEETISNDKSV